MHNALYFFLKKILKLASNLSYLWHIHCIPILLLLFLMEIMNGKQVIEMPVIVFVCLIKFPVLQFLHL